MFYPKKKNVPCVLAVFLGSVLHLPVGYSCFVVLLKFFAIFETVDLKSLPSKSGAYASSGIVSMISSVNGPSLFLYRR